MINDRSSLTLAGWAVAHLLHWDSIDSERPAAEEYQRDRESRKTAACWAFGAPDTALGGRETDEQARAHNGQVASLINALGEIGAGRRAMLRAVATRQGIDDEDDVEDLLHGRSERKLQVPPGLREDLHGVGLGHALMPVNLFLTPEKDSVLGASNEKWEDLEIEVSLDSGSVVHVCALADCPGYLLQESAGSRRGQEFLLGDGGTIPNRGQT